MAEVSRAAALESGVWGVLPTPFVGSDARVDTTSLATLVAFYEAAGATGLTVLGVFGEAASLTAAERSRVLSCASQSGSLPIVAGVTSRATQPAIEEIEAAQDAVGTRLRAAMVQVNNARPQVVVDHLCAIHDATHVPVVLQDYPSSSGVSMAPDDLIEVVRQCPFVCAVKEEDRPTAVVIARIAASAVTAVFGGLGGQNLLDELAVGSAGTMTGFSFPEALVACVGAWQAGDHEGAAVLLQPYLPTVNFEQQPGIALAVRKEMFRRRGLIADGRVRAPAAPFPESLSGVAELRLREALATAGTI